MRSPIARLANYDADGPEPHYAVPLDAAGIRRAGEIVPDGATYYVDAPGADGLLTGSLAAATHLLLAGALPVREARNADWVLHYEGGRVRVEARR